MGVTARRWDWIGLAIGTSIGLFDFAVMIAFGADMVVGGRDATLAVLGAFALTYAGLGLLVGRLAMARERARGDADLIAEQLGELRRAQQRVIQQEKLAGIGRLAAGVAHEVRNPLGVIRASASMLREQFDPVDDSHRACTFIEEEIDRLNALITSLLTFARPAEPRLRPVFLEKVLDRALELAREPLTRGDVCVERASEGHVGELDADSDLLAQLVLGLLHNAVEAMDPGGRIELRLVAADTEVWIDVADSGPGVGEADARQIFEPFFTTKASGTGLGLPMAARIAQVHGGALELVPGFGAGSGGRGACFRLRLPLSGPSRPGDA